MHRPNFILILLPFILTIFCRLMPFFLQYFVDLFNTKKMHRYHVAFFFDNILYTYAFFFLFFYNILYTYASFFYNILYTYLIRLQT